MGASMPPPHNKCVFWARRPKKGGTERPPRFAQGVNHVGEGGTGVASNLPHRWVVPQLLSLV